MEKGRANPARFTPLETGKATGSATQALSFLDLLGRLETLIQRWRDLATMHDAQPRWRQVANAQRICADEISALIAQVPRGPQEERAEPWQPIATCPKDGTWFLAWDYDGDFYVFRDGPGLIAGENPQPTHWMPLPLPPTSAEGPATAPAPPQETNNKVTRSGEFGEGPAPQHAATREKGL